MSSAKRTGKTKNGIERLRTFALCAALLGTACIAHAAAERDTHHGFDSPNRFGPVHLDVPNGVRPGQGVTVASNAAARDDAYLRMKEQLRTALAP